MECWRLPVCNPRGEESLTQWFIHNYNDSLHFFLKISKYGLTYSVGKVFYIQIPITTLYMSYYVFLLIKKYAVFHRRKESIVLWLPYLISLSQQEGQNQSPETVFFFFFSFKNPFCIALFFPQVP